MSLKYLGLIYDLPSNYDVVEDNNQLIKNCYPTDVIKAFSSRISQKGFSVKEISSTEELHKLTAIGVNEYFCGFINLGQGVGYNYSYAQAAFLIEMTGLPYGGNTPYSMIVARNKHSCKNYLSYHNILSPKSFVVNKDNHHNLTDSDISNILWIIKPNNGSSSDKISESSKCSKPEVKDIVKEHFSYSSQSLIVEEFISGIETTVFMVQRGEEWQAYPLIMVADDYDLLSGSFIYCSNRKSSKWRDGRVRWVRPEKYLNKSCIDELIKSSTSICAHLELRDFARIDFRIDNNERIFFIECNTCPHISFGSTIVSTINKDYLEFGPNLEEMVINSMVNRIAKNKK